MIIPTDFIEVFARYRSGIGHECQNVWAFATSGAIGPTQADQISAALAPSYKAQLNGAGRFEGVHILIGNGTDSPGFIDSTSGAGAGARGNALAAPMCMGLIKKQTAFSGRKNRGRIFIPDMTEGDVGDDGSVQSAGLVLLSNIASAWFPGLATAVVAVDEPVLLHGDDSTPTEIVGWTVETKVATLRRRYNR